MRLSGFDENVEEKQGKERKRGNGEKFVLVEKAEVEGKIVEKAIGGMSFEGRTTCKQ